jgi:aldehyde:ferredoxin oxidoreductase
MNTFTGNRLTVDLSDSTIEIEPVDPDFSRCFIGGRGFTSRLNYELNPVDLDPLSPESVMVIAPGALSGSPAFSTARFVVGVRSPLTGIFGDANGGGFWGAHLRRAGFSVVVIRGRAEKPVYLKIDDERVSIEDAAGLWGKDTHETTDVLQAALGNAYRIAAIGQAGENLVSIAGIVVDKDHLAARCGVGAVMGSKNLKAMAVRCSKPFPLANPELFKSAVAQLRNLEENDARLKDFTRRGTLGTLMDHHTHLGGTNTMNYQYGQFAGKESIDGEALIKSYLVKTTGCYTCPTRCDRWCEVNEGEFAGTKVGGPEYCTAAAFGSGIGNDNLAAILKGNDLADRYGMDTLDLGGVLAFAFELYQRGILTKDDTGGLDLVWGNYRAALELVRRIAYREGFLGETLAHGVKGAAEIIGKNSSRYGVHIKGMTPAPLDARVVKVYNFRYAVSPRGGDHLRISAPGAYGLDEKPIEEAVSHLHSWESVITLPDLMGVCKFPYTYYTDTVDITLKKMLEIIPQLYTAATGFELDKEDLMEAAMRVNHLERAYNARLGLRAKDDILPPRFTEDAMPEGPARGKVFDILEPIRVAWYKQHGWDEEGIPTRATLEDYDLADIAADLEKHNITLH